MAFFGILANLYRISQCWAPGVTQENSRRNVPAASPDAEAAARLGIGAARLPGTGRGDGWQPGGWESQTLLGQPVPHINHELQPSETFSRAAGVRPPPFPSHMCTHTLAEQAQGQPWLPGQCPHGPAQEPP